MNVKKWFLRAQAALCVILALLLACGAVSIYLDGTALRAEDPLSSIYTPDKVAEKLAFIVPLFILTLGLAAAGAALGLRDPNAERPAMGEGRVTAAVPKHLRLIRTALVVAAAAFILLGVLNGSARDVLVKAIHICTECIGLG